MTKQLTLDNFPVTKPLSFFLTTEQAKALDFYVPRVAIRPEEYVRCPHCLLTVKDPEKDLPELPPCDCPHCGRCYTVDSSKEWLVGVITAADAEYRFWKLSKDAGVR